MEPNQYKIVTKEIKGISLIGFTIENADGNKKNISLQDAIKLDVLNSEYMIDIENGIDILPYSDRTKSIKLSLLGRLIGTEGKCIGYKAQDDKGKVYKLSISKVWDLAEQGSIVGIKARVSSKGRVVESTDECNLSELPIFKS